MIAAETNNCKPRNVGFGVSVKASVGSQFQNDPYKHAPASGLFSEQSLCSPVLHLQPSHPAEFLFVVGDQRQP